MKKLIFGGTLLLFIVLFPGYRIAAQDTTLIERTDETINNSGMGIPQAFPLPPQPPMGFRGQNQSYSVTLRGNGEAVVSARIVFTNTQDSDVSSIRLRVPRVDPKDVIAFQVLQERICIGGYMQKAPDAKPGTPLICNKYLEPDYYTHYTKNSTYQKAGVEIHGDTIEITLPRAVSPEKSGAFILYYRAFGYTKKNIFGAFTFSFETLKVEDTIRELTVGISTDSDLFLKGVKGKVDYRINDSEMVLKSSDLTTAGASPQLERLYQQIGYGVITKKATDLQPLDSYIVHGAYAQNYLGLYGKEISIAIFITILIVMLCIVVGKKIFSWLFSSHAQESGKKNVHMSVFVSAGLGFATSLCILFYTAGLILVSTTMRQLMGYDQTFIIIHILLTMISVAIYALLLFVPSIVVGVKKGISWGLGTFVATVMWLIFEMFVAFFMLFFFARFQNRSYPVPMMESIMGGGGVRANIDKSTEIKPMKQKVEKSSGSNQETTLPPDAAWGNQTQ